MGIRDLIIVFKYEGFLKIHLCFMNIEPLQSQTKCFVLFLSLYQPGREFNLNGRNLIRHKNNLTLYWL